MSADAPGIVIVGGGHAGGSAATFLRQYGWQGAITIIGEETIAPYQRPPLSKGWLKGEATLDSVALKPTSFYVTAKVGLRLGARAVGIDRAAHTVRLESGDILRYHRLILATGSRLRRLNVPGTTRSD